MRLHRNAKTTPMSRQLMVHRLTHEGWTATAVAAAHGVSLRTVYKWHGRARHGGSAALEDGSSRPLGQPRLTPAERIATIVGLRRQRLTGRAIAEVLRMPRSTVSAILRRVGLGQLRALDPKPVVQRYEWPHAGDLLHLDIKALGRIRGLGHRITGDRRTRARGVGWEAAHIAIDDATRLAYVEVLPNQRDVTCAAFLRRAVQWFRQLGITPVRLLTDNGSGYRSRVFRAACVAHALVHKWTRPYTPRTNGKAERFIQTLLREWAYARPYETSAERQRALRPWLRYYNRQRPHAGIQYQTPWTRLQVAA